MQNALILVDFENEWIDPYSDYYVGDISGVLDKTNKLIDHCRQNDFKIIFTQHIERDSKDEFVQNTSAVEIIPQLHKETNNVIVTKYKISPFYQTNLAEELKNTKHVVVAGILTNLCVRSFVEEAYDRDFAITVIKDCCVAFDDNTQNFTFTDLKATREEVTFLNVNEFIDVHA